MKYQIKIISNAGNQSEVETGQCASRWEALESVLPHARVLFMRANGIRRSIFECEGEDGTWFEAHVTEIHDGSEKASSIQGNVPYTDEPVTVWVDCDASCPVGDDAVELRGVRVRMAAVGSPWVPLSELADEHGFHVTDEQVAEHLVGCHVYAAEQFCSDLIVSV